MNCDRIRQAASSYVDQDLSLHRRAEVEDHLAGCPECSRWFQTLHRTRGLLAELGEEAVAPQTERRLMAAFRDWARARHATADLVAEAPADDLLAQVDRIQSLVFESHEGADRMASSLLAEARAGTSRDRLVVALACKANTLRLRNRFDEAASHLNQAEEEAGREGGCSPRAAAVLASIQGSLADALGQFEHARALFERAIADADAAGDSILVARSEIGLASTLLDLGRHEEALHLLSGTLGVLEEAGDLRWQATALHNTIVCLQELERFDEAYEILGRLQGLCSRLGESLRFVKLAWLEASVLEADGRLDEAAERLSWVRRRSLEEGNPYWAAFAALDLAGILLQQGRTAEIRDLAHEIIAVFRSFGIQRETLAALFILRKAAELERVTTSLLAEVAERLRRGFR